MTTSEELPTICPRCDDHDIRVLTVSPVPGAWTMFSCHTCFYSWRTTEPSYATDPATYPAVFKIDPKTIPDMPLFPSVPDPRR
ncbi:MAG: vanillate/4-hydroxybenzoate decarboxylase subunit [Pseudonocardiales bacterium]|jgi:hypothetical protein|nr:vanillate/4-hydroxybenzoate decarboxylase subunit [Pseudonocardiales bacterium]